MWGSLCSTRTRATIAGLAGNCIFGLSFIFSKMALNRVQPMAFLSIRFLTAFTAMNLLLLIGRVRIDFHKKKKWRLLLLGLFQPVTYFLCESYGLIYTTATFSAIMIALVPIASLLYGAMFLQERPTVTQCLWGALSMAGVVVMSLLQSESGTIRPIGILLLSGAVVAATGFNAVSKKTADSFTAFERTYGMFLMGSVVFTAIAFVSGGGSFGYLAIVKEPTVLLAALYLGIISSVLAFVCLNYANEHLTLAKAASFANLSTVVSVLAGAVFMHETMSLGMACTSVIIIAGVWGIQKKKELQP